MPDTLEDTLAASQAVLDNSQEILESDPAAEESPFAGEDAGFIPEESGLSYREKLFIRSYIRNNFSINKTAAVMSKKSWTKEHCQQMLLRTDIQAALMRRMGKNERIAGATKGYAIDALVEVIETGRQQVPYMDRRGTVIGFALQDPQSVIKASVALGQALGLFQEGGKAPVGAGVQPSQEVRKINVKGLANGLLQQAIDKMKKEKE